jgi:hypothetical protein
VTRAQAHWQNDFHVCLKMKVSFVLIVVSILLCFHYVDYTNTCLSFFHLPTAGLGLNSNSLTGTIPNQIGLLTKLSKSSVL